MTKQINISEMTDRELKLYRRKLKKLIIFRRRCMLLLATICLILIGTVCYHSIKSNANENTDNLTFKYYTSITVESGETLWEISDRFIDYSKYTNKAAYIAEVQHINHLDAQGGIQAGQKLVIPYYSKEFVQ